MYIIHNHSNFTNKQWYIPIVQVIIRKIRMYIPFEKYMVDNEVTCVNYLQ